MEFPKYEKSIVNLMASILTYYGAKSDYNTIEVVDQELKKGYKHLLLLVLDGLGDSAITEHLQEDDILYKNRVDHMQSVYPPTTTAAMTSYYSGLTPAEHGWLGWSLHFRDYGTIVDIFPNVNSTTSEPMATKRIAYIEMPYKTVYEKIHDIQEEGLEIHTIMPEKIYFPSNPNRHHPARDLDHITKIMKKTMEEDKPSFTAAYLPEPDTTMHINGPSTLAVKQIVNKLNDWVEEMVGSLHDTLVIVSADHGQTDITKEHNLEENEELRKQLVIPPTIEGRAASFFVKSKYKDSFRETFEKYYGDEFILLSHQEAIEKELFGKGDYHHMYDDFVGDFIACGTANSILKFKTTGGVEGYHYKGHHAGLTKEEMRIPLIMIG